MRGNVKKMFVWVPVQFTLIFRLVSRQFDWHPWSAKCLQLWDFKINCWVCWWPLIVSACDTGDLWEGKTTSSAQGTQNLDYYPLALPFIFLHSNPLLTFIETWQQYIEETEMKTGQLNTNSFSSTYYLRICGHYTSWLDCIALFLQALFSVWWL